MLSCLPSFGGVESQAFQPWPELITLPARNPRFQFAETQMKEKPR